MRSTIDPTRALPGLILALALLAGAPSPAGAQEPSDRPDPGNHGRIRFLSGGVDILRVAEDSAEPGSVNAPVFAGDQVLTGPAGRVEVQLADGSLARLGDLTTAEFRSMIDPYGRIADATIIRLSAGRMYLDVRGGSGGGTLFQVDTASASVYIETAGLFRIDADEDGYRIRVASHRGAAEVVSDEGSVYLRSGQKTTVDSGHSPTRPVSFNSFAMDSFDRWNEERVTYYARSGRERRYRYEDDDVDYERIPDEVRPYAGELSNYGRWTVVPDYGVVWYPVGVGPSWRPYVHGDWTYGPYGWYWVSSDPWGWAPYRYGRWCFTSSFGWVWAPGRVFGGAWVSWYYGPRYIGWCPLDYYDRPAFINISFRLGGYGCDPYLWSFVPRHKFVVKNIRKHVVRHVPPGHLRDGVVVRRAIPARPALLATRHGARDVVLEDARRLAARDRIAGVRDGGGRSSSGTVLAKRSFRDQERATLDDLRRADRRRAPSPDGSARDRSIPARADRARGSSAEKIRGPSRSGTGRSATATPRTFDRPSDSRGAARKATPAVRPDRPNDAGKGSARPRSIDRGDEGRKGVTRSASPRTFDRREDVRKGPARDAGPRTFRRDDGARGQEARPKARPSDERLRKLFRDAGRRSRQTAAGRSSGKSGGETGQRATSGKRRGKTSATSGKGGGSGSQRKARASGGGSRSKPSGTSSPRKGSSGRKSSKGSKKK